MHLPLPVRVQILKSCDDGTPPHSPLLQILPRPPGGCLPGRTNSPNSPRPNGLLLPLLESMLRIRCQVQEGKGVVRGQR